jgi:LEA14-like dessication related protein
MKILFTILIILALLGAIAYMWATRTWSKITFSPPTLDENIQGLTLATISGQTISLPLTIHIANASTSSIPFSSITAQLLYKGTVIAETADANSYTLPANGNLTITDTVNITLNDAAKALFVDKVSGNHPVIDYAITAKVYGIPLDKIPFFPPIKSSFTW